ncbi:hypothetical protein M3Y99_01628300 [Aphelenchoides fujianensis]|nr:hypothetical protein M3Y99_01628300 [Aphelenchoides fujianensis]
MAVVRNPMERFIAAFTAQCVLNKQAEDVKQKCGDCDRNSTCFLERLEKKLTAFVANPTWLKRRSTRRLSSRRTGNMKLLNDLYFGLRERDVNNDDLTLMYKTLQEIRPAEGTRDVDESILESELRANPRAMEIFTRIYAADYRLFKFELPTAAVA